MVKVRIPVLRASLQIDSFGRGDRQFFNEFDITTSNPIVYEGSGDVAPGDQVQVYFSIERMVDTTTTTDGDANGFIIHIKDGIQTQVAGPRVYASSQAFIRDNNTYIVGANDSTLQSSFFLFNSAGRVISKALSNEGETKYKYC